MEKIEGLSIGLDLDSTALNRGLTGVKDKLKSVNSEMKANLSAFDRSDRSIGKYETRLTGLNRKLEVQKEVTKQAKLEYEKMVREHGEGSKEADKAASSYNAEVAALNNLERYVGNVREELKKLKEEQRVASSGWTKAGDSLINFGSGLKSISDKTKDVGKSLTQKLTLPAVGAASALAGITLVKGFNRLVGIDTARAKLTGLGHDAKGVEKIMTSALDAVRGTSFGMDEAATTAANAVAAGVKEGKDLTTYLSLTGDAAAIAGSSMSEMGSILNKVKTSNKAYNGELQQLSDRGLPIYQWLAEEAGVAAGAVSKMASDGEVSSEMLMNAIEKNIGGAAGKMGEESFTAGIANMWAAVGRLGASFLDAGGKGGGFFSQLKPLIADFTGRLDSMGDFSAKAGVKFGELFSGVVDKVKSVKAAYDNLTPSVQDLIKKFGIAGAVITVGLGPVLIGLGTFGGLVASLALKIGPLFKRIAEAGGLLKWLRLGFTALTGPVGITIGVLALLGTGFILLYKNSETFRNGVHNLLGKIKELAKNALKAIQPAIQAIISFFKNQLDILKKFWDENGQVIMDALSNIGKIIKVVFGAIVKVIQLAMPLVLTIIKSVWSNIKGGISGALNIIMGLVKVFSGLFTGNFGSMWEGIKQVFFGALTFIWNYVQLMFWGKMLKGILSLGKLLLNSFKGIWGSIKNVFSRVIKWIVDFVKNQFTSMNNTLNIITNSIKNIISTIWNGIFTFFKTIIQSIWNLVKNRFTTLKNTINTIFSGIRDLTKTIWNAIKNAIYTPIKNAVTNTLSRFTSLKSRISEIFGSVKKSVKGYVSDMVETVKGMPKRMSDGLKKTGGLIKAGVVLVANRMVSGLGKGVNGVIDGVNWVMGLVGVDKKNQLKPWKVPQYAKGTDGHPEDGPAIVGDGGMPELLSFPNGKFALSPATDTLVNLPRATSVMSGPDTKLFLKSIPAYKDGKGWLTKIKEGAGAAWDGAMKIGSKAASGIKTGVSALKDKASQLWDWASGGAKGLMDKVLNTMGVKIPKVNGNFGKIAKGAFGMVKDKVINFVGGILPSFGGGGFSFPAPFRKTSGYGQRWGKLHKGIDFGAPAGTPIPSQSGGVVRFAGFGKTGSGYGGYGNVVHIDAGGGLSYLYAHNSKNNVKTGDSVRNGQIIGTVGNTGHSTGNHLHFEVRRNNQAVNPESLGGGGFFGATGASGQIKTWITQAINATGVPKSWLDPLSTIAMKESGGNPKSINNWDSNAKRGTPSKGLMQTIDPTFNAHKMKGMNDIWNPVHNAVAAIRYIKSRYKTVFNTPGIKSMMNGGSYKGYATGGLINHAGMYNLAEDGWPEFVIPTNPARRTAAQKLLALAGREIQGNKRPHQLPNVSSSTGSEENNLLMQLLEATLKQNQLLKKDHAEMMAYLKAIAEKTADVYLGREKVGSLLDQDQAKRINHAGRRMAT
ncbi:peptidoglycan DD-metalloendopeptidase family protein [Peribacillus sp. FSL E2-0218]|uniref:peptidoglycan DD-metalloendopeptidase family protein n=1 Tax=Peribacillus sp. FSL E2-0218 TaxID=2921364 RepID=UPI0030EC02ED